MNNILVFHFTHIDNLSGIIQNGLLADNKIACGNYVNSGNLEIKENRKKKKIFSGKYVGDYVPFYFAPRSPMMYKQHCNGTIENEKIIYLVACANIIAQKYEWCCSNINAAKFDANFYNDWQDMLANIDWRLMKLQFWNNTEDDNNRKDRRMAEFLVYEKVNFVDFIGIATYNDVVKSNLSKLFGSRLRYISVRPDWYF